VNEQCFALNDNILALFCHIIKWYPIAYTKCIYLYITFIFKKGPNIRYTQKRHK